MEDENKGKLNDKKKDESNLPEKEDITPLYQAWGLTKMRYDFTVGEKNIFLKVIEVCQKYIRKEYLGTDNSITMVREGLGGEVPQIEFSIKDLLKGSSKNYDWVKQSLESLGNKYFGIPEAEGWDFKKTVLFDTIEGSEKKGKLRVTLTSGFWKAFFDLKVFKIIDTNVAYNLKSIYSKRMYELLVGNRKVVTYNIDHLKQMFCVEDKYKQTGAFILRVIKTAQNEMYGMENCPFYFKYTTDGPGRKIETISFIVIDKEAEKESQKRIEALRQEAEGVKLSENVLKSVEKCFPKLVIREDVELKLKRLQKQIGEAELCKKIEKIKAQTDKLQKEDKLTSTASAYFIGSLDKINEEIVQTEKEKRIYRNKIEEAEVISEVNKDGYEYWSEAQLKEKCELAGMKLEDFIREFKIEKMDDNTYRIKID